MYVCTKKNVTVHSSYLYRMDWWERLRAFILGEVTSKSG